MPKAGTNAVTKYILPILRLVWSQTRRLSSDTGHDVH